MMKFNVVDFGSTVPFALIADDVTLVVPRFVTEPVTVCVKLVLSAPDVVEATSTECVCVELATVLSTVPVEWKNVVLALGVPDVTAAGFTVCVWSPCVDTAIVSA
jgi:hypothetical protein